MITTISALHFDWASVDEALKAAASDFGLRGVEFSWHESFRRPHCTREDVERLRRQTLIPPSQLSAHIWDDPVALGKRGARQSMVRWLEVCRATGIRNLVLHGGTHRRRKDGVLQARDTLESLLPMLEREGVALHVENHYPYEYENKGELFSEPWEFLELMRLGSPSLRFCFDTGHANMSRNSEELLRELSPWLNYVHLADNHGVHDDHCGFGRGTVDWSLVARVLRETGFAGFMCVEFPVRDDREPFRDCQEWLTAEIGTPGAR